MFKLLYKQVDNVSIEAPLFERYFFGLSSLAIDTIGLIALDDNRGIGTT